MQMKPIAITSLFLAKIIDIPAMIFKQSECRLHLFPQTNILRFVGLRGMLLKVLCALADVLVTLKLRNMKYLAYSALFPCDIASLCNLANLYDLPGMYVKEALILFDPAYLLLDASKIPRILDMCFLPPVQGATLAQAYLIGYGNNHIPGLNGFWYLHMCMIEQYSKLCYTLVLVFAGFLLKREARLLPLFLNGSSFINFLPYLTQSRFINIFLCLAYIFEYLFMLFRTADIINTNFLFWASHVFCLFYLADLKCFKKGNNV